MGRLCRIQLFRFFSDELRMIITGTPKPKQAAEQREVGLEHKHPGLGFIYPAKAEVIEKGKSSAHPWGLPGDRPRPECPTLAPAPAPVPGHTSSAQPPQDAEPSVSLPSVTGKAQPLCREPQL